MLIVDINDRGGSDVAKAMPDSMSFFRADVGEQEDWRRLVDTAKSRYGRLDCLVNNAGTTYHNKVELDLPSSMALARVLIMACLAHFERYRS